MDFVTLKRGAPRGTFDLRPVWQRETRSGKPRHTTVCAMCVRRIYSATARCELLRDMRYVCVCVCVCCNVQTVAASCA